MKINEIFYSIQGESSFAGMPTIFIRTSGCPLRCTYCDTTYAYYEGASIENSELLKKIKDYRCSRICLTGGEPLAQKESFAFVKQLCDLGYSVSVETSGAISCKNMDPRVQKIIDIKTPDSGAKDTFNFENLELNTPMTCEFKFVICSEKDFLWAESFVEKHEVTRKGAVFYSPSHDTITPQWLAQKMLSTNSCARLQLQLHKYIWPQVSRGV